MTQNQINYAKLREEERHNRATEGYSAIELQEAQRHNVASENINWYGAQESQRHNVASENLNWYTAPSQVAYNESRTAYNAAQTQYIPGYYELEQQKVDLSQLKQNLEEKIADMNWYRIYYDVENDRVRAEAQASQADTAARRVSEEVENWLRNYDFEVYQYNKTGRQKQVSEIVRNYVAAGKDATSIADAIINIINKIDERRSERKDWIPDYLK